jgi:hypothetical protein
MIEMHNQANGRGKPTPQSQAPQGGGAPPDQADIAGAATTQSPPIPPPDAPHEIKAQAYSFYLQRMASDPRYQELGPAGKSVVEKQLHDRIFGEGQQ